MSTGLRGYIEAQERKAQAEHRDELQATCDELAEALEALEDAYVKRCSNWNTNSYNPDFDGFVRVARAALARYRGE